MGSIKKTTAEIRQERLREPPPGRDIYVACLWPKNGENLGTTLRTCDAVGATLVVPRSANAAQAIRRGNTIGVHNSRVELIDEPPLSWLWSQKRTHRIVGVELAFDSIPLEDLAPSDRPTIVVMGHETTGIPQEALAMCDVVVEIPMEGVGNSLNVSVSAALALYKVRGWA